MSHIAPLCPLASPRSPPTIQPMDPITQRLLRRLEGTQGAYRHQFKAAAPTIAALLAEGHGTGEVYQALLETGALTCSYRTFQRYLARLRASAGTHDG